MSEEKTIKKEPSYVEAMKEVTRERIGEKIVYAEKVEVKFSKDFGKTFKKGKKYQVGKLKAEAFKKMGVAK